MKARESPGRLTARARALALTFAAALSVSLLAAKNDRLPGDLWLTRHVQDVAGWFEPLAEAARAITTTQTVLILGFMLGVAMLFVSERRLAATCFGAIAVLPFLQAGIKNVVDRPRPPASLVERRATFTSESFPSGHTMSGTVLLLLVVLVLLSIDLPRWQRRVGIAVASIVLFVSILGDVYLGMHWPSDVLGGVLWASALVGASALLARRYIPRAA